jgi:cyclic beta-1,2-glucan synthetase
LLSSIDWPLFFDRVSVVEQILRGDPVGAYAEMDFPTRDRYRHSVEQLSKRSNEPEIGVAQRALALARTAQQNEPLHDRSHHVGYYLISRGRFVLERELRYPAHAGERLARFVFEHPALGYLGTIAVTIAVSVSSLVAYASRQGASIPELWLVALIALIPVSELAISLLNALLTSQIPPRQLPKLAMRAGIPALDRTIVVVPTIIDSVPRVETLLHDLEVRFLANRDPHLHFALLSDFPDAAQPSVPGDEELLQLARRRVDELNERHGADRFFFLHRERRWNARERCWMGWERKRGKLDEFNRLLRGATDTSFVVRHGEVSILGSIKYVITLDSDTRLPMEAARRLVGTLSHPLNRPRFDSRLQRVTQGYGVLQPRVQVSIESASRTAFAQVFAGHVGVDPYTTAVSDVYQDLFHEGSYVGKGIYDVDAFHAALAERVPEETLLSHDLFEGLYARAGLCTDIELVDDFPSNYLAYAARQHRWVRGDWQIARWLWRTVPDASGRPVPNTLPVIARWKILDNLRRSLLAPALVVLFLAGWTVLPGSAIVWSLLGLLVLAFPACTQVARSLSNRVRGVPFRDHVRAERDRLATTATQAFLSTVLLLHQSWVMLDAIVRALVRMLGSRRRLLEWVTAERSSRIAESPADLFRRMAGAPIAATIMAVGMAMVAPSRLPLALPVLALWFISPAVAYATGRPLRHTHAILHRAGRTAFRRVARRTWRFFDDLVGPADHWLIPDNIQEDRREVVAPRTSPTNIGLQLLSTLAAYDFGYLNITALLNRLEPTFATLLTMQRYRGHFYNWYDTSSLAPLPPTYISTVDSGNLAGYLVTLRAGLADVTNRAPLISATFLEGLEDVIVLAEEEIERAIVESRGATGVARGLKEELAQLHTQLAERPATLAAWSLLLSQIRDRLAALGVLMHEVEEPQLVRGTGAAALALVEAGYWLDRAATAVMERQDDLQQLAPWAEQLEQPGSAVAAPASASIPSLAELVAWGARTMEAGVAGPLGALIDRSRRHAVDLIERAERLEVLADDLVEETEFNFLFNPERQLFSIGFNVAEGRLDASYYDTLASEARLASFLAIATGKLPPDHWFRLGRSLTPAGSLRALLSWSASMFEYLMPSLVMKAYPGTLLDETYAAVVQRQIEYARHRGVPWGISECAYYAQDLEGNYQYRAFGVPGLGLKRGLADDLVIAPYASMLATSLAPDAVLTNLEHLREQGMAGRYGYYEAIDYTADRLPKGHAGGIVLPTYMAHHQGMSLLALDNALHGSPMQSRFHADPRVQAAELLLQERIPHLVPLTNPPIEKAAHVPSARQHTALSLRRYVTPHTLSPRAHLLSNGSYAVMLTNAGGGYSRRQHLAMTRWREDLTADPWGSFIYVRDLDTRQVWSTAFQPTGREPDEYEVTFAPDRATFRRLDAGIELRTEIVVSPEDDVELRRVSLTNHSNRTRSLDVTSYAEVVLAPGDADLAHPAFSNLFVETTAVPERDALLCVRRPRTGTDRLHLIHVLSGRGRLGGATEYETDRARFVGRGRTLARPLALVGTGTLSNTTGAVLDPIVSLRQSVRIPPGGTARLAFTTGFAENEDAARQLIEKYHDRRAVARALALASAHSQVELRHLGLSIEETLRFQRLAGRLLYGDPRLRDADAVRTNTRGQPELWKYGISGDVPILLVRLKDGTGIPLFRQLLKAHEYLRLKGLAVDLVVLNEHASSYLQDLQNTLIQIVESGPEQAWVDRAGGVFLRRSDLMPPEDRRLLRAAARVVMDAPDGNLRQQLKRTPIPFGPDAGLIARFTAPAPAAQEPRREAAGSPADLEMFNGTGGFADEGREYVIHVDHDEGALPPAPWFNVVAHPTFGFGASECGAGYTWSVNSHENRLTPWRNDPVSDAPGEAVFIRDEDTGRFWSATPLPTGAGAPYTVRHGQGYTTFEHARDGLASALRLFVPPSDGVKVYQLTLRNQTARRRRHTVTLYVEWVLGENRSRTQLYVVTSRDPATGALFARNAFRQEFSDRVAFLELHPGEPRTMTGDRMEFLGRNGTLAQPAALLRESLSNRTGAALDPCGAIQVTVVLEPRETRTLIGLLGDAASVEEARALVERYRTADAADEALEKVRGFWNRLLGTLVVRTPDRSMDLMLNRWLPYQSLACRVWGRSAFYQSSGAFGFRDQLQDVLGLMFAAPSLARGHLLHAASRQFVEGDVQHWWHEPGGQGVRTRFSDDRLWLVYAALHYTSATGDASVLDEQVSFLEGRLLKPDEHEAYERPTVSREKASLYEHCVRAVALNLETGAHGLPLIGTGDWNDGMNMVGAEGRGESVWLAWFLLSVLRPFADVAAARGDVTRAAAYRQHSDRLIEAIEAAWDGAWYRRAYFDDGTPLGSRENTECRIDSIAQSWAVIAGGGDPARARQAMESVMEHLVRRDDRLVLLLTPPFERMVPSPGYIEGYVPGVRENGGQYTHAALWTVLACATAGDGDRAMDLFAMLNPANHARTPDEVSLYRAEPYVVAADVYSSMPHTGRGGWTWYTGSAGWMYRVGVESILGFTLKDGALRIDPCIPRDWRRFEAVLRTLRAEFHIEVENPEGVNRGVRTIEVDGVASAERGIGIAQATGSHHVRVVLGRIS